MSNLFTIPKIPMESSLDIKILSVYNVSYLIHSHSFSKGSGRSVYIIFSITYFMQYDVKLIGFNMKI